MANLPAATRRGTAAVGTKLAFVAGLSIALWGFYFEVSRYPPYVDYDTATIGIFTNNLTWQGQYDHGFRDSLDFQERYRGFWAAHFLPVGVVLSVLQSALGVEPESVGDLLQAVTLVLGLAGCLCAAAVVRRRQGTTWWDGAFVVGLAASFPPLLLYLRSDLIHVLSFALFWACLLFLLRFLHSRSLFDGGVLALLFALFVLQPAPSLPGLVLAGFVLAGLQVRREGLRTVFHRNAVLSLLLLVAATQAIPAAAAWSCGADAGDVKRRATRFVELRSGHAFAPTYRDPALLGDKLTKLVHQHFVFGRDDLGDPTREDEIWTLPHPHVVWILLLPLVLAGLLRGFRDGDEASVAILAALAGVVAVMLSVSFPEGRYLLPVVPCYAYGAWLGLRSILAPEAAGTSNRGVCGPAAAHTLVQAAILAAMGIGSFAAIRGDYSESMLAAGRGQAGLREAVSLIRRQYGKGYGLDQPLLLGHQRLSYKEGLYLSMLTNFQYRRLDPNDFVQLAAQEPAMFAVAEVEDREANLIWRGRGFRVIGEVDDAPSSRRFVVFASR
ncbi:MAG: hypothetical protein ABR538_01965 [Candidatus Binatia bacterium]